MKSTSIKTTTYTAHDDIVIDVVELSDVYEAWIYRKNIGLKSLMFEVPKEQQSYDEFLEIVEANIDEHITFYDEETEG